MNKYTLIVLVGSTRYELDFITEMSLELFKKEGNLLECEEIREVTQKNTTNELVSYWIMEEKEVV